MDYVELDLVCTDEEQREIIMAEISDYPFESFDFEGSGRLRCYIEQTKLCDCKASVDELLASYGISQARYISIETQNWNAAWEANFPRVEVGNKLLIRAPFHESDPSFAREVIIMPKMSFGTGHHDTTNMMADWVCTLSEEGKIAGRRVLDMGSGTGVLAIVAALSGAEAVDALDIDDWAFENCKENVQVNGVEEKVCPLLGNVEAIAGKEYDLILANINRNILLADMPQYLATLSDGGDLIISGFLEADIDALKARAEELSLVFADKKISQGGWVSLRFSKK